MPSSFKILSILFFIVLNSFVVAAKEASELFYTLRTKVLSVKDFTADVKMKIDINNMRIPLLKGTLYFKSPDKMRMERNGGLSILPKKNINLTLGNLIPTGNVMVIDVGYDTLAGKRVHIIKAVPEDELSNIVLTKIWIDETNLLAMRTETTTRNDGTVKMNLEFANYIKYALPDKVTIFLDVKDFKLPKGVTVDYNVNATPDTNAKTGKQKLQKGTIQISYLKYAINTGLGDELFAKGKEE